MAFLNWFSTLATVVQIVLAFFLVLVIAFVLLFVFKVLQGKTAKLFNKKYLPHILDVFFGIDEDEEEKEETNVEQEKQINKKEDEGDE